MLAIVFVSGFQIVTKLKGIHLCTSKPMRHEQGFAEKKGLFKEMVPGLEALVS